ncbi:WG repeat-containing protein [Hymenobacter weizhouensis]|uniref:WG repeat-containing protein n=1 Tax=Hymenobacter sp. YIM 151500-1 TaxID=2987689 RepID=UPI002225FB95|nr:WG repeat-containing protein [Hymenobacter sp. YIM 151500-1]UYZ62472.1 WG repeat-containing protein [Hymenobacter sp. YIM 151500-1]
MNCLRLLLCLLLYLPLGPAGAQTSSRLVPFRQGTKWGYADRSRRLVLPARYDEAGPLVQEIAWVRQGPLFGYIDGGGNPVTPVQYSRASTFRRGRATVELNGETFDIGETGRRLTEPAPPEPEEEPLEHGDLVRQEGKVGFRFTVGSAVVPPLYDEIRENYNGLLFVRQGAKWGVVNSKGKLVQPVQYDAIGQQGNVVLPLVQKNGLFGYLDEEGNTLTEVRYRQAEPFFGDIARVLAPDGLPGYIDATGKEYWEAEVK